MPHTSHKKRRAQPTKRVQVEDENGWTRVTTSSVLQRAPPALTAQLDFENKKFGPGTDQAPDGRQRQAIPYAGASVEQLQQHFKRLERQWLQSRAWSELCHTLCNAIDRRVILAVDRCLLFGSGSFCGQVFEWIERHETALLQLAVFKSVVDCIEMLYGRNVKRPLAQEPVYNDVDEAFLASLGIEVARDLGGYQGITTSSVVYAPNAEVHVMLAVLSREPGVWIGNGRLNRFWRNDRGEACSIVRPTDKDLEEVEHDKIVRRDLGEWLDTGFAIQDRFTSHKDVFRPPNFEMKDEPFYDVHVYARRIHESNEDAAEIAHDTS